MNWSSVFFTADVISQWAIFFIGPLSIFILSLKNKYHRWGYVFGLSAQPFWYITTIHHSQWPILAISVIYTLAWLHGIYQWFFCKKNNESF